MSLRHVATLKWPAILRGYCTTHCTNCSVPLRMTLWSSDVSQWHIVLIEWCSNNIWGHLSMYIEYGDITVSFIYPIEAQLECSKRMVKYTLIFTWEVLFTCFDFPQPSSGSYYMWFAKAIIINNQLKYVCLQSQFGHSVSQSPNWL
jgi:hypothetical protein